MNRRTMRDAIGRCSSRALWRACVMLAASAGLLSSCGGAGGGNSGTPGTGNGGLGNVAFVLTVPNGVRLNTVSYQLTDGAGDALQSGSVDVHDSQSIEFQLGNVPPGAGYHVSVTSNGTGGVTCAGSAGPFSVAARATTAVKIGMACYTSPGDAGNVFVTGTPYLCGSWSSLATVGPDHQGTSGSEVNVGGTITLVATANGPDPQGLTYAWSSSKPIGTFGANQASGATDTTTFVCNVPGTTTITLVVGDGPVPAGSACDPALSTVTTQVTCDAPAAQFDHVTFTIATGPQPLDAAASAAVTLEPQSGSPQTFLVKPAGGAAWKANTTHTATFALKPTLGSCDVATAVVSFTPGAGQDPSGAPPSGVWALNGLRAVLSIDGADQTTIVDASGGPQAPLALLSTKVPSFTQAASCPTGASLFSRLGGQPAMTVVANDFVSRLGADRRLGGLFSSALATPAAQAAASAWLVAEMCHLSGGGCAVPGASPFLGAATIDQGLALLQDLTAAVSGFPAPATVADENQLLGSALVVDQNPLPLPLLPNGQPDPQAAVGSPIPSPQYYNLYWDSNWDGDNAAFPREAVDSLEAAALGSSYYAGLSEYGVGSGRFLGSSLPNSACTQKSPSSVGFYDPVNPSIIGFLNCELQNDSSVPQGDNVVYNIILPTGSLEADAIAQLVGTPPDCAGGALAWHFHGTPYNAGSFIGGLIGGALGLGIGSPGLGAVAGFLVGLATQGGPFYTISSVDPRCGAYTNDLLHEMVESATDSEPGLDVITSGGTGEIADMCMGGSASWVPGSATLSPGTFLSDNVPQYWSNAAQACGPGFGSTVSPSISGVSFSGTFPTLSLTISGSGFGALPAPFVVPWGGLLPYLGVQDTTQAWQAGNALNTDPVEMTVTGWSDSAITIDSFSPPSASFVLAGGDALELWVCNPASGNCATRTTTAPGSSGGGGPNPNDFVSIDVTFQTGGDDARADTELQLQVAGQPTTDCLKPSNNASPDAVCANGGSARDQNGKQGWDNFTTDGPQTFALPSPTTALTSMNVTLISHNNGTEGDDNWDIQSALVVGTRRNGTTQTLLNLSSSGDCVARLKAAPNATTVTFTLDGTNGHVYANGKAGEIGQVTTCTNNGDGG
jgi:hypothetical protein